MSKGDYVVDFSLTSKDLNLKPDEEGNIEEPTLADQKAIFENVIGNCSVSKDPKGPKGPKIFIYNKILRKLDQAEEAKLTLADTELKLLKELFTFENLNIHPTQVRAFSAFLEKLEPIWDNMNKKNRGDSGGKEE